MDQQKLQDILAEKWKYLFYSEYSNSYEIYELVIDYMLIKENVVDEIELTVDLDYLGAVDATPLDMANMLKTVTKDLIDFFYKFPFNPNTKKIDREFKDFIVYDPMILEVHFKYDELHKVLVSIVLDYEKYQ